MRVVDLFAGCGGLSLGFQKAGFEIEAAFDNWDKAIDVYKKNLHHTVIQTDLSNVHLVSKIIENFTPDIIIGGPPCQDFSSAGKRDENNGRGDLTVSYAEIVSIVKPKWFVMENVDRIIRTKKLQIAKRIFKVAGYGLTGMILDASLCGVPQKRKRFILVGCQGEADDFLHYYLKNNQATKPMTLYDYFGNSLGVEYYYRHPRSYARRGIFSIYEPSPTIRGVNRPIPSGYYLHKSDPVISLSDVRALTTKERSMIQTFPKDFEFIGTKTDVEQMIGNAVPVNLGKFIANAILGFVNDSSKTTHKQQFSLFS